jgi:hypothetical protein
MLQFQQMSSVPAVYYYSFHTFGTCRNKLHERVGRGVVETKFGACVNHTARTNAVEEGIPRVGIINIIIITPRQERRL